MSTHISIHTNSGDVKVTAHSVRTSGAPLQIRVTDDGATVAEVCIYTESQEYTDALIAAINGVPCPIADAAEAAE